MEAKLSKENRKISYLAPHTWPIGDHTLWCDQEEKESDSHSSRITYIFLSCQFLWLLGAVIQRLYGFSKMMYVSFFLKVSVFF